MRPPILVRPCGNARGSALILLVLAIAAVGIVLHGTTVLTSRALEAAASRESADRLDAAARGAVAILSQRLAAVAAERLGDLAQPDIDALNAGLGTIEPANGASLLPSASGIALVAAGDLDPLPYDEEPLELWTDQLRRSYALVPPVGGRIAARTLVFVVYATVAGPLGERRSARRTLAVSRVPPHQDAIYSAGHAEVCAAPATTNRVAGTVHVDGMLNLADCGAGTEILGSIVAADGLAVSGRHLLGDGVTWTALASVSRAEAEADPDAATAAWSGRLRIPAAVGARVPATRFATAASAGSGECLDFSGTSACGGAAAYHPSLHLRGAPGSPQHACGAAYAGLPCAAALAALSWTPWPFGTAPDLGAAAPDPARPDRLWRGLYPDPRMHPRCAATVAGHAWRTYRCPTNPWGWTLDAAALPALPGGVLSVSRSTGFPAPADPEGSSEVLLIRNARRLSGPLTIHSQLPVALAGSFNVDDPKPAMIVAPRITVLPNEADDQLRTTAVWDSVPPTGAAGPRALPLAAHSNVTIYAVLRAGTCRATGGLDFGGVWRGAPAVLGDWSRAGLRIVGAVETADETPLGTAHCSRWGAALDAVPPGGTPTLQPRSREVLFDTRLLHPGFQPPGSWSAANIPEDGAAGAPSRTRARQAHAIGGTVALRVVAPTESGPFTLPARVPFPDPRPLPSPPLPLP
ncbi:MAG TPA: hypothetical protein VFS20_07020 [Longimicrobium sp.]|nr:hypothetical protein [Longimicrobium sp.]